MISKTKSLLALTCAAGLSLSVVGCSSDSASTSTVSDAGSIDCSAFEEYGDLSGTSVSVYTAIVSPEADPYIESFKPFEQCTGASIDYEGDKSFNEQINIRIQGNTAPDIAFVPQPGLIQELAQAAVPVNDKVSINVDENFGDDWRAYGTVDAVLYGIPLGASVKSLVWYSPAAFESNGYEVPETWDELLALTKTIAQDYNDDGITRPWCVGFGAGDSTGWVGTDWIEDILLRTAGGDTYDQWTSHEIAFNDSAVKDAFDAAGEILLNDDYVNGGLGDHTTIATTQFTDAGTPILQGQCFLHRQASFQAANWPEGTTVGPDGDVWAFYLPAVDPTQARPVTGGGDFAMMFDDRPEVNAFMEYLSSGDWANARAKASPNGGAVSANKKLDTANLANEVDKLSVEMLQDDKAVFRFDGSDLMPAAVGSGSFWNGIVAWVSEDKPTDDVLDNIEASWPAQS